MSALAVGGALTAEAAPLGMIGLADDDTPTDTPTDIPPEMQADIATATPTDIPTATPTVTPTAIPTATPTPNPTVIATAIQQVIQRSNDEQVQAIATRNVSLVADTVTDAHFQELTGILQDMLNHQVTGIAVLKLDWGPITVAADGSGATATTYETWRIVSTAGSIDYDPVRNDYTLVLDNAAWKIKSDVQVVGPLQPPRSGVPPP